jgi:hypothetical protein
MSASVNTVVQFSTLTILLTIGLSAVIGAAFRVNVAANWDEQRCDSYVVPLAGFFKPTNDPRTAAQFATDNWTFCQKEYIQNALRVAAEAPKELAAAEAATVGVIQDVTSVVADVFFDLWKFCFETYSSFMDQMKVMGKLFHNFMINLYSITERLNASALAIIYGMIALLVTIINSIQVTLIVAIIVVGIILVLQIILFFMLLPISGLIITVTALVSVVVVAVATAVAAAMVAELFSPGACFAADTVVQLKDGALKTISEIRMGDILRDGGRVTAIHRFHSRDAFYNLHGIRVTGDHLVADPDIPTTRLRVEKHPEAIKEAVPWLNREIWCLTTTTRCIPCSGSNGVVVFADWEEIPERDTHSLRQWFYEVWDTLNGSRGIRSAKENVLASEAGLSPDCRVLCADWLGRSIEKPVREIRIGDRVWDSKGTITTVVGKVMIAGDQTTDAVEIETPTGVQVVSCATWVHRDGLWKPIEGVVRAMHPVWWEHLYTQSGVFMIAGGYRVRDASDVGLDGLRPLVDSVVLDRQERI